MGSAGLTDGLLTGEAAAGTALEAEAAEAPPEAPADGDWPSTRGLFEGGSGTGGRATSPTLIRSRGTPWSGAPAAGGLPLL